MKRYLFFAMLITSAMLSACRGNDEDVDPNKTLVYVGTWKGEQKKENGYENRTDWVVTREDNNAIKIVSTFNFISTSAAYQSYTEETVLDKVEVTNDHTLTASFSMPISGDTLDAKSVGVVTDNLLTVTSNGKFRKSGQAITPTVQKFTKQ